MMALSSFVSILAAATVWQSTTASTVHRPEPALRYLSLLQQQQQQQEHYDQKSARRSQLRLGQAEEEDGAHAVAGPAVRLAKADPVITILGDDSPNDWNQQRWSKTPTKNLTGNLTALEIIPPNNNSNSSWNMTTDAAAAAAVEHSAASAAATPSMVTTLTWLGLPEEGGWLILGVSCTALLLFF